MTTANIKLNPATRMHLVLGGARSGKSRFAENLAQQLCAENNWNKTYLATATVLDDEMQQRIQRHRDDRDHTWRLVEEPVALAKSLTQFNQQDCIVIDCLSLWLSNCLHANIWPEQQQTFLQQIDNMLAANAQQAQTTSNAPAAIIMVSNEVGQGIVPLGELSRRFVDESGWLHQALAKRCQQVSFITAGLAQSLK